MASTVAILEAKLLANTRDFDEGLDRAHSKMSVLGKAAGVLGLAIAAGLGVAAKIGFDEMQQGAKVSAQTEAVLKSTGGTANVTAQQIDSLAGSLLKKSGVDDEAIKSGENMLLTFTRIRNEAGQGNDVFNQATKATLDLSVAMGKDMQSSAILVGKALNDPIKGLAALTRVGVSFTAAQREQIKALVESGDAMGAQKIILKELNTEFGGSAEAVGKTLPGQINIARESFKNLAADLTTALLPAFTAIVNEMVVVVNWLTEHKTAAKLLVGVLAGLAVTLGLVSVATKVVAAAQVIARAAVVAWTAAQWLLNVALTANPIGLVVIAIAALVAAIVIAYTHVGSFRKLFTEAFDAVKSAANAVLSFFRSNWPIIATLISGPFAPLVALATNAFGIRSALTGAFDAVIAFMRTLPGRIVGAMGDVRHLLYNAGSSIIQGLIDGLTSKLGEVEHLAGSIAGKIAHLKGPIEYDRKLLVPHGQAIIEGLQTGMEAKLGGLYGSVSQIAPTLSAAAPTAAFGAVGGAGDTHVTNVNIDGEPILQVVWDGIRQRAQVFQQRNGRPAF